MIWQSELPQFAPHFRHFSKALTKTEPISRIPDEENVETRFREAVVQLARYSPAAAEAATLLVAQVILARTASCGGGSTHDTVGTVWMRPGTTWTSEEFAESLLHESTHQGLMLEELARELFAREGEAMRAPPALVRSAVWPYTSGSKERRPFDAAFHSACVAVELSAWFAWLGRDDASRGFLAGARTTAGEIRARMEYLTPGGVSVLLDLERRVAGDTTEKKTAASCCDVAP